MIAKKLPQLSIKINHKVVQILLYPIVIMLVCRLYNMAYNGLGLHDVFLLGVSETKLSTYHRTLLDAQMVMLPRQPPIKKYSCSPCYAQCFFQSSRCSSNCSTLIFSVKPWLCNAKWSVLKLQTNASTTVRLFSMLPPL